MQRIAKQECPHGAKISAADEDSQKTGGSRDEKEADAQPANPE